MSEYRAPEGRPRSCPPLLFANGAHKESVEAAPHKTRRPLATIDAAGVIDDYIAEFQWGEICARRNCNPWHISQIIKNAGLKKRTDSAAPPPAAADEEPGAYGRAVRASFAKEERACRALCRRLNKNEPGGQWMTSLQTVERGLFKTLGGVPQRVKNSGWKRAKGAGVRLFIYLVPYGSKLARPSDRTETRIAPMISPPKATRWQRFRRWMGF